MKKKMDFKEKMRAKVIVIDQALDKFLPLGDTYPPSIHQAMRYSLFAGGKRLRPILVLAAAEAVGGRSEEVIPTACALELIHTYSLIHDDLPAMDNDDYRRGKLTNHKIYGEAKAILAGDGLLTLAFQIIAQNSQGLSAAKVLEVIGEISIAAGTLGMIGGQVVDSESENKHIDPETLHYIHTCKTGALYKAALRSGAILAGATTEQLLALTNYAEKLGLAFQITDDILDIEGDEKLLGKPVGSDLKNQKSTYPSLFGLAKAKEMAADAVADAVASLAPFGQNASLLKEIALYLLSRDH